MKAPPPSGGAETQGPARPALKEQGFRLRSPARTTTGRLDLPPRQDARRNKPQTERASITDLSRDDLKEALLAVVDKTWTERDAAIRAAARHLGFKRTGKRIRKAFASAITGLLRQKKLESAGSQIRRP